MTPITTGWLRWINGIGTAWHLTFTGSDTLCGVEILALDRTLRALSQGPPQIRCGECSKIIRDLVGLPAKPNEDPEPEDDGSTWPEEASA